MRGMTMREMKARQLGRAPKISPKPERELPIAIEDETDEPIDAGELVDQGDGVRVSRGRLRMSDDSNDGYRDLPDDPPPGWLGRD